MDIETFGYILSGGLDGRAPACAVGNDFVTLYGSAMNRSQVERISKALGDATRLRIFEALSATAQMTCGEIAAMRGVTPATVSHHLKVLSDAGLIACRRDGQFVYSRAVPEAIAAYTQALVKIAGGREESRRRESR